MYVEKYYLMWPPHTSNFHLTHVASFSNQHNAHFHDKSQIQMGLNLINKGIFQYTRTDLKIKFDICAVALCLHKVCAWLHEQFSVRAIIKIRLKWIVILQHSNCRLAVRILAFSNKKITFRDKFFIAKSFNFRH